MKHIIYALIDPNTDQVKLIGTTKMSIKERIRLYKVSCNSRDNTTTKWLKSIDYNPNYIILDTIEGSKQDAEWWEAHYIFLYRSWNFDLLNQKLSMRKGFFKQSKEQKNKLSIIRSNTNKGRTWVTNGVINKFVYPNNIPNGFYKGLKSGEK